MGMHQRMSITVRISATLAALAAAVAPAAAEPALSPLERLGKAIFFDTELSVGRNQSCAMCHAPDAGFTGPRSDVNAAGAVVEGSIAGRFGNSKPPSAAYAAQAPVLYHKYEDGEILFVGGAFWNGRATGKKLASVAADQAQGPFLNPLEMALPDSACVVQRVCRPANPAHYPVKLIDVWGAETCAINLPADLEDRCAKADARISLAKPTRKAVDEAYDRIALSIAAFETSREVNPFSSKYDLFLAGKADLTPEERQGLELFKEKGKCAKCHIMEPGPQGGPPLLTDFTYDNLGVPRNPANPFYAARKANPLGARWVEEGLRTTLVKDRLYRGEARGQKGKVKVPTVRNGDLRPSPGFVKAPEVRENLNTKEMGNLKLTQAEEDAIVAFMKALPDGYTPSQTSR